MTHPTPRFPSPGQLAAHCKPIVNAIKAGNFDGLDATFKGGMQDMAFPVAVINEVNYQLAGTTYKIEEVEAKDTDERTTETTIHVTNGATECTRFVITWTHMPFKH